MTFTECTPTHSHVSFQVPLPIKAAAPGLIPKQGGIYAYDNVLRLHPLAIHGTSAKYMLDTGANISALTESEAKRLGLTVHETSTKLSDIIGTSSAIRLAEVPDLRIGRIHLKNVAFSIFPNGNECFGELPNGHKGVLGIPVLLALASLHVEKDNRIVVGSRESTLSDQSIPLTFDNMKNFADAFPALMKLGQQRQQKMGCTEPSDQETIYVPTVRFSLAQGVEVDLAPVTVILNATVDGTAGSFGFDLFDKALPVTIDFRAMRLSFS